MPPQNDDWFSQNAPKPKAKPAAETDWFSSNAPGAVSRTPPPAFPSRELQMAPPEAQAAARTRETPMETSWLRSPWEAATGFVKGIADPITQLWQAGKQKDIEMGGHGAAPMGIPEVLLESLAGGERESQRRMGEGIRSGRPTAIAENLPIVGTMGRGIAETAKEDPFRAAGQLASFEVYPRVGRLTKAALEAPPISEMARDTARRVVRAGPAQLERAETAAGTGRESAITANREAAVRAKGEYRQAEAARGAEHQAAEEAARQEHVGQLAEWEKHTQEGVRAVEEKRAQQATQHAEKVKGVQEANKQAQAQVAQREQFIQQSGQHAEQLADSLQELEKAANKEAKEMYPKITGTAEGGGERVGEAVRAAAEQRLKGSGTMPDVIQRIVNDYAPKQAGEPLEIFGEAVDPDSPIAQGLLEDPNLPPEIRAQLEAGTTKEPTFETLHGQYSELGREYWRGQNAGMPGDSLASIAAARDVVAGEMQALAKAAGKTGEFAKAQKNYAQFQNTFHNSMSPARGGSPVARALDAIDPITGKLRPDYVRQALSETKAHKLATQLLSRYKNAPVAILKAMKDALDQADLLPKKAKVLAEPTAPKPIADFVPKEQPTLALPEPPAPLDKFKYPGFKKVPQPFNREQFVRGRTQQAAEELQATKGFTGLYRHPVGRVLESEPVKGWIAKEPPAPLRAQPGNPGAQGGTSPYEPPVPKTPPTLRERIMGKVKGIKETASRGSTERRTNLKLRSSDIMQRKDLMRTPDPATMKHYLDSLGLKVDPNRLKVDIKHASSLYSELYTALKELGEKPLDATKIRSMQDALDMKNLTPYQIGTRIRERLGLPTGITGE